MYIYSLQKFLYYYTLCNVYTKRVAERYKTRFVPPSKYPKFNRSLSANKNKLVDILKFFTSAAKSISNGRSFRSLANEKTKIMRMYKPASSTIRNKVNKKVESVTWNRDESAKKNRTRSNLVEK